jgi:putative ABC transport system substrate-binding protein
MNEKSWFQVLRSCSANRKSKIQNGKWARLLVIHFVLVVAGALAEAQPEKRVRRIGILRSGSASSLNSASQHEVLRQGLRELGYVEGKNLLIEYRYGENDPDRLSELARELVQLKVEVIVPSPGPRPVRAVQRATRTVPIVMTGTTVDPVKAGFAVSLARPGGNITGLVNLSLELDGKRLELIKEAFPQISRVAIIGPPQPSSIVKERKSSLKAVRQTLGIASAVNVSSDDIENTFSNIIRDRYEALLVVSTWYAVAHRQRIIDFAAKRRLPAIYTRHTFVEAGGLMSYAADETDVFRRVATYVDKILKGSMPADLPIERPTKFELVINLKTAKQIGLTIPQSVLYRADKVIK